MIVTFTPLGALATFPDTPETAMVDGYRVPTAGTCGQLIGAGFVNVTAGASASFAELLAAPGEKNPLIVVAKSESGPMGKRAEYTRSRPVASEAGETDFAEATILAASEDKTKTRPKRLMIPRTSLDIGCFFILSSVR